MPPVESSTAVLEPDVRAERTRVALPYYGWAMVVLAAAAMAATLPGRTHGLGLITKRMLDQLAIEPLTFAQINLWATLLGATFCLPCGWLLDRYGVRIVSGAVVLLLAVTVVAMTHVEPGQVWLLAGLVLLTRVLGQSMLSVVSITMVGKWFQRRLGIAMGVYSVLMTIAMAAGTGLLGKFIREYDWRAAWAGQGWLLLGLGLVLWIAARSRPRDLRVEFTAQAADDLAEAMPAPGSRGQSSATLTDALTSLCFWTFAGAISFFGMMSAGLSLFNQYILEERGLGEEVFHRVLVIGMLAGLAANLATGAVARAASMPRLLAVAMTLLAAAWCWFPFIHSANQAYAFAVVQGLAGGALTVLFFAVWGIAYGPRHLGRIQAAAQALTVVASAAGPLLVKGTEELLGSYRPVFFAAAAAAIAWAVLAWFTRLPAPAAEEA